MLSVTTDFSVSRGCPEPALKLISEIGFTHIHWCHQWNTDFLYSDVEIQQIKKWLKKYNLKVCDLHASSGNEKCWFSENEYARLAGVELVKNRINMVTQLGSDVIIMHPALEYNDSQKKSLDELESYARFHDVRIACENSTEVYFKVLDKIFADYPSDYVGLCYDSGHGHLDKNSRGLDKLKQYKNRLISVHLHDNLGESDQHWIPFEGNIDWNKLIKIISQSSYKKMISMELMQRKSDFTDSREYLQLAYQRGLKLSEMLKNSRFHTG